jgi:SAM-dependent methyltransferase
MCASQRVRLRRRLTANYRLLACEQCEVGFADSMTNADPAFYASARDVASLERHSGPTPWYLEHPTRETPLFRKPAVGRLLDIGCGNGAFAEFAAAAGYEVEGVDPDSTSVGIARARQIHGAAFHCEPVESFLHRRRSEASFDVVTLFEVFEHLQHPRESLDLIRAAVRPGGWLVGSLPNARRPLLWQLHMDYEMPPYHLTYWSVSAWRRALTSRNFAVRRCDASIYYGYLADVLLHSQPPRLARTVLARVLRPIEAAVERGLGLGASLYFEARRDLFPAAAS